MSITGYILTGVALSVPTHTVCEFLDYKHCSGPAGTFSESSQNPRHTHDWPAGCPPFSWWRFFPYRSLWHSQTIVWVAWTLRLDNIDQRMVTASCREKQRIGGWALWERSPTGHNTLQTWRQALRSVLPVSVRHDFKHSCIWIENYIFKLGSIFTCYECA